MRDLARAGFYQVDSQIKFRINLSQLQPTVSTVRLNCQFADEKAFDLTAAVIADFSHERFSHLPGCTPTRINQRYALWAQDLLAEHPATCMQLML
ncbi:MAG: hypothetical protein HQL47_07570, partial [Gammaproteobacteria bacterium]|nr:hypothetical protein [Gammaproteobacteria bacterium]